MSDSGNIDEFSNSDSFNLKIIDGQKFTIIKWEKSDYDDKGESVDGIKFTTEEDFAGKNMIHTTRQIIVRKFYKMKEGVIVPTELGLAVTNGTKFAVICKEMEAKKGGNNYFDLIAAKDTKGKLD